MARSLERSPGHRPTPGTETPIPRLYLLRHGKSSWDDPALADHDRPLAPRGRRAAKLIRNHLREAGIRPELVLCSTATRARETLERVGPGLGDDTEVRIDAVLYTFSATDLLKELRTVRADRASALVIGHNPALQELALHVARGGTHLEALARKYPTAALATLELSCEWAELGPRTASLVSLVRPQDLPKTD